MADPATPPPAAPKGGGSSSLLKGKIAGVPKPVAIFGLAAAGTLVFLWWRSHRGGTGTPTSSASSFATATASAYTSAEAAEISALQSELAGLLAQQTAGTSPATSKATSTATSTAPAHGKPTHAPSGTSGQVTSDGARLTCGNLEFATKYRWRVWEATRAHPVVADHTTTYTTYSVTGLKPGTRYGWHVAGVNSAGQGPYSATQHFTTKGAGHIVQPFGTAAANGAKT